MFWKSSGVKEQEILEDKIMRFMRKAESLKEKQPKLAYRFLTQACRLYQEKFDNYSPKIDEEFNHIFIDVSKRYFLSPEVKKLRLI